LKAERPPESIQ